MMSVVSATVLNGAGLARAQRAELWLDDLRWHRSMFRQSRFRWTGEHAMDIVTRSTGGCLDYSTVGHLRWLQRRQDEVRDRGTQCQSAMADPLRQAHAVVGWDRAAEAVGLTVVDCRLTLAFAAGTTEAERSNVDVRRVLAQLPFANPLIEVWELKQLWRLFDAARDLLEDTLCDLLEELLETHPVDALVDATGIPAGRPTARIAQARLQRGVAGDPRRTPSQRF